jgi:CheY-like chemotaxis protein
MTMKNENNEYFDLSILLKQGDLDIRRIAETGALSVGEYSAILSKFIDLAPDVTDGLNKFIKMDADNRQWVKIENMLALLTDLGCKTCIPEFYSISHARGRGDWRLAAFHAKKLVEDFGELQSRVLEARRTRKPDDAPDAETSLKEYLQGRDNEEARRQGVDEALGVLAAVTEEVRRGQPAPAAGDAQASSKDADRKPLILAVDDSPDILTAVASVLSDEYKVFKLPKPAMLQNVLQQINPDLFLLDYQMPEMSGFDLVPIIRSLEKHRDTPIIFLTSAGTVDNISTAIGLGASDFIVKPFMPDVLREKIQRHLPEKHQ